MFWEASAPLTAQSSSSSALAPLRPWWTRARGCTVRETPDLASTEVAVLDGCQMVMVVDETKDHYTGVERVQIAAPVRGWVATALLSRSEPAASPSRPLAAPKILCLHGAKTSAAILEKQCALLVATVDATFVFLDAPHRNATPPDPRVKSIVGEKEFSTTVNFSWWTGNQSRIDQETSDYVAKALIEHKADGVLGVGAGAAVAAQMSFYHEDLRFVVLIAAVADGAVERMDKNCPTMHIYDPSSNWALSASRLMYNFHTRALGEHTDGNAIPYSDPRPFRLLNNFVAEFVGGHDRELESRCFQP